MHFHCKSNIQMDRFREDSVFCLSLQGGMYLYQIVDWYAASLCVMLTSFLECIVVGWIYGK